MRDSSRTVWLLTLAHFSHHALTALLTPLGYVTGAVVGVCALVLAAGKRTISK